MPQVPLSYTQEGEEVPAGQPGDTSPTAALTMDQVSWPPLTPWCNKHFTGDPCVPHGAPDTDRLQRLLQVGSSCSYSPVTRSGFWPLLHSMADRVVFDEDHWQAYRSPLTSLFITSSITTINIPISKEAGPVAGKKNTTIRQNGPKVAPK